MNVWGHALASGRAWVGTQASVVPGPTWSTSSRLLPLVSLVQQGAPAFLRSLQETVLEEGHSSSREDRPLFLPLSDPHLHLGHGHRHWLARPPPSHTSEASSPKGPPGRAGHPQAVGDSSHLLSEAGLS